MKKTFLYSIVFALSLALGFSSCSDKDDDTAQKQEQTQNNQNTSDNNNQNTEVILVSELKCTVSEFETKYQTLKKDEPVSVTLTDVSNDNISKVSAVLKKMSGSSLQKAAEESKYIIALVLESKDKNLTSIPAEAFKGCAVLKAIEIPDSVTEILADAFAGCAILETVKLPETVDIAEGAFEGSKYQPEEENSTEEEKPAEPVIESINISDIAITACGNGKIKVNLLLTTNTPSIKEFGIYDLDEQLVMDFYQTDCRDDIKNVTLGRAERINCQSIELPVDIYTIRAKTKTSIASKTIGNELSFEIGSPNSSILGSYGSITQSKSYLLTEALEDTRYVELICAGDIMKKASSAGNMNIKSNCARTCIINASGSTVNQFGVSESVVLISEYGTIAKIQYSDYNESDLTYTVSGVMYNNTDSYKVDIKSIMLD